MRNIIIVFAGVVRHSSKDARTRPRNIPKTIWNFDGGIFLETDGSFNENTCFRLAGRVVSEHFFDNLKRIDDDDGTQYIRGKETHHGISRKR